MHPIRSRHICRRKEEPIDTLRMASISASFQCIKQTVHLVTRIDIPAWVQMSTASYGLKCGILSDKECNVNSAPVKKTENRKAYPHTLARLDRHAFSLCITGRGWCMSYQSTQDPTNSLRIVVC